MYAGKVTYSLYLVAGIGVGTDFKLRGRGGGHGLKRKGTEHKRSGSSVGEFVTYSVLLNIVLLEFTPSFRKTMRNIKKLVPVFIRHLHAIKHININIESTLSSIDPSLRNFLRKRCILNLVLSLSISKHDCSYTLQSIITITFPLSGFSKIMIYFYYVFKPNLKGNIINDYGYLTFVISLQVNL